MAQRSHILVHNIKIAKTPPFPAVFGFITCGTFFDFVEVLTVAQHAPYAYQLRKMNFPLRLHCPTGAIQCGEIWQTIQDMALASMLR